MVVVGSVPCFSCFRDQKVAPKPIMAKTGVNLTPECGIRSSRQRCRGGIDVARLQPNSALYYERPTVRRKEDDYKFTDSARLCPKPFRRKSRRDRPGLWPDRDTARRRKYWI